MADIDPHFVLLLFTKMMLVRFLTRRNPYLREVFRNFHDGERIYRKYLRGLGLDEQGQITSSSVSTTPKIFQEVS